MSFTAIRKEAGLFCGSFLRKGEVFAYAELSQNLKDRKVTSLVSLASVKSLWLSLFGVETPDSPSRGCAGEWMFLHGVVSPE